MIPCAFHLDNFKLTALPYMKLSIQIGIVTFTASLLTGIVHAEYNDDDGIRTGNTNTIGTDDYNAAFGTNNEVSGMSMAVGDDNTVANGSFALGSANIFDAFSGYSGLMGFSNSIVESGYSFMFGEGNSMERQSDAFIAGQYNTMIFPTGKIGYNNFILGFQNEINATGISGFDIQQSILLGAANKASASRAWVLGGGNIGQYQTVTLGLYNQTVSDAALIVGNGTNDTNRNNALVVLKNGNASLQGSLTLAGSPAVTTSYLSTNQYLTKEWGSGADAASNAILAFGPGAEAEAASSVAIGAYSTASAEGSIAIGSNSVVGSSGYESIALTGGSATGANSFAAIYGDASGYGSFATQEAVASGDMSIALAGFDLVYEVKNVSEGDYSVTIGGTGNQASGDNSFASGYWTKSNSAYSVALGSMNSAAPGDAYQWIETDALFELGNGWAARSGSEPSSGVRSNAITTLKNGETTLTNKAWKLNVAGTGDPLEDPPATPTDSGGRALVVEGHTELRGKVIIAEPQGDISMGIYE
jgi:hypothetical protein